MINICGELRESPESPDTGAACWEGKNREVHSVEETLVRRALLVEGCWDELRYLTTKLEMERSQIIACWSTTYCRIF